jgi:hypothetical protein
MKRPRTQCPWCKRDVALKTTGVLYAHNRRHPFGIHSTILCPGAHRRPDEFRTLLERKDKDHGISAPSA